MSRALRVAPLPQANSDVHVDRAYRPDRDRVQPIDQPLLVAHSRTRGIVHREEWFDTESLPLRQTQSDPQHALQMLLGEPSQHLLAHQPTS